MDYKRREAVEYTGLTDKGGIAERQEIMARTAAGKRVITVILSLMIAFAYMPIHTQDVFGCKVRLISMTDPKERHDCPDERHKIPFVPTSAPTGDANH